MGAECISGPWPTLGLIRPCLHRYFQTMPQNGALPMQKRSYICVTNYLFSSSAHKFKSTVYANIKHFQENVLIGVVQGKNPFLDIFIQIMPHWSHLDFQKSFQLFINENNVFKVFQRLNLSWTDHQVKNFLFLLIFLLTNIHT